MEKETIDKLNEIQRRMSTLNMIKQRVDNKDGHFQISFGIAINENGIYCPIVGEKVLTEGLIKMTQIYIEEKLAKLQKELDEL